MNYKFNISLFIIILFPVLLFSQGYSVQSIQKINNIEGSLTGSPLESIDRFGVGVAVIGDVDHDGIDDIAVGSYMDDDGGTKQGAVYILMLNADGTVKSQQKISATSGNGPTFTVGHLYFGVDIAALGDLNGDGNVDIAVGMFGGGDDGFGGAFGAVYILFLDDTGNVLEYQKISNTQGGGPGTLETNDYFGFRIDNLGDVNGDGLPDLAIGTSSDDDGGSGVGAIYIANLDYNGTAKNIQKISATSGGFTGTLEANDVFRMGSALGDLDGDGINDMAVGASGDDDGGSGRGAVWILFLNADGTVKSHQKISDTQGGFTGVLDDSDGFGIGVTLADDLDGDGRKEIIVSATKDDDGGADEGAFWILYLNADGTVKTHDKISTTDAILSPEVVGGEQFTYNISYFGDRNNDGKIDLLIGAWNANDSSVVTGEVYITHLEGQATYPNKEYHETPQYITALEKHSALAGEPLENELDASDNYGMSSCSIGDLDGDGINDMVVGAHNDDDGGSNRGAVYIQFLNADGSIKSYQKISDTQGGFTGTLVNADRFGISLSAIGDLNNDGNQDIAVGAFQDDDGGTARGAIWILFLDTNGTVKSHQKISDTQGGFTGTLDNGDYFGYSLTSTGDIDGDGIPDLIAGAVYDDDGGTNRGALWVLFLDTNGTVKSHQKISDIAGNFTETLNDIDMLATDVCSIGDIDADGVIDIAVGASRDDDAATDGGAIYVLLMTDSGYVKSSVKITDDVGGFTGHVDVSDYFGGGITGGYDLNLDGINDILVGAPDNDNGGTDRGVVWVLFMNSDGTVNHHQTISTTSNQLTGLLDQFDRFGFSISVVDYNEQSNTAKIAIGAYKDGDGATDAGAIYMLTIDLTEMYDPSYLTGSFHKSINDQQYNWSYGESYDEDGNIISQSKQYVDQLGRKTQSMSKNFDKNRILTTQTIYDTYGRPVINTLPAPIGQNLAYKTNFITDNNGDNYDYQNFDITTTLNSPDSIGNSISNGLGDYYSDSGEDDYLATSAFPYSRVEYMADPTGRVKRSAAPGENFKMGSGHESRVFYMFTGGELDRAYGGDSSFYCQTSSSNRLQSVALSNTEIVAEKTISVDAEGKIAISFVSDGLTISTCVSGMTPTPSVPEQSATNIMLYAGTQSVDIHLPEAKSTTLKLPLPQYEDGGTQTVGDTEIVYTIMDLENNSVLVETTKYTINSSTRFVTFTGTNKHRFLRISYAYTPTKLTYFEDNSITPPNDTLEYKLDYSHFTANYYDLAGRLRMNVSPKGFDYSVNGKHTEFSRYDYSPYGQLIAQETPDEGLTEFLYSDEGVVRFSQNAQQNVDDKFSYVRYDDYNRSIESGEYDEYGIGASYVFANYYASIGSTDIKNIVDDVGFVFGTTYTNDRSYIAYDVLASADEIPSGYTYKSQYPQHNLKGNVSKTWNDNNQTWYSYDYAGRSEYLVQELLDVNYSTDNDSTVKTVEYTYASVTSILLKEEYQKNLASEKLTNDYTYNTNQQLVSVTAKDNGGTTLGEAAFEYNINGQLKRKELGGTLQGMDYVYTLHGQLKSINHPSLYDTYDPGQDGKAGTTNASFEADLFGFTLDYYEDDYMRTGSNIKSSVTTSADGYNNGLIKASRWKVKDENQINATSPVTLYTAGSNDKELMYEYSYDNFYRFETSTFGVFDNDAASSAFAARTDFRVFGTSDSSGVDYDIIGNITDLNRNGYTAIGGPLLLMDSLTYTYTSGKSQLSSIVDNSSSTYSSDFETTGTDNFTYNSLGQMITSDADGVIGLTYYPNGQVKKVTFTDTTTTEYFYNERGIKIKSIHTPISGSGVTTNWYMVDASGALRTIHQKVDAAATSMTSRVVYGGGRLGIYDVVNSKMNYELSDHLGNVRVTFTDNGSGLDVESWSDYYPFGEVMPGRNSNPTDHLYGYQGQEKVGNGSKWYNFNLRMYNPALGRFNTIDPYSQFNSPYLAMANNPISFVDPDGGRAELTYNDRERLLRKLFFDKSKLTRIEWLRRWLQYAGVNHYNGVTMEGFYAAIGEGTARGIAAVSGWGMDSYGAGQQGTIGSDVASAVDAYMGPLGDGFLDNPLENEFAGDKGNFSSGAESGNFIDGLKVSDFALGQLVDNLTQEQIQEVTSNSVSFGYNYKSRKYSDNSKGMFGEGVSHRRRREILNSQAKAYNDAKKKVREDTKVLIAALNAVQGTKTYSVRKFLNGKIIQLDFSKISDVQKAAHIFAGIAANSTAVDLHQLFSNFVAKGTAWGTASNSNTISLGERPTNINLDFDNVTLNVSLNIGLFRNIHGHVKPINFQGGWNDVTKKNGQEWDIYKTYRFNIGVRSSGGNRRLIYLLEWLNLR
jgi:RHS repeat-associated protein